MDKLIIKVTLNFPDNFVEDDPRRARNVREGCEANLLDHLVDLVAADGEVTACWNNNDTQWP